MNGGEPLAPDIAVISTCDWVSSSAVSRPLGEYGMDEDTEESGLQAGIVADGSRFPSAESYRHGDGRLVCGIDKAFTPYLADLPSNLCWRLFSTASQHHRRSAVTTDYQPSKKTRTRQPRASEHT